MSEPGKTQGAPFHGKAIAEVVQKLAVLPEFRYFVTELRRFRDAEMRTALLPEINTSRDYAAGRAAALCQTVDLLESLANGRL